MAAPDWQDLWRACGPAAGADPLAAAVRAYTVFGECVQNAFRQAPHGGADFIAVLERVLAAGMESASPFDVNELAGPSAAWCRLLLQMTVPGAATPWAGLARHWMDELLRVTPLGPQREIVEAAQALGRTTLELEVATATLNGQHRLLWSDVIGNFGTKLGEANGAPITSLAALYDEWIDVCESTWTDFAMQADYARAHGAWINALTAQRGAVNRLVQQLTASVGVAGPTDLEHAAIRIADLERMVDELQRTATHAQNSSAVPAATADTTTERATVPSPPTGRSKSSKGANKRPRKAAVAARPTAASERRARAKKTPVGSATARAAARAKGRTEFDIGHILAPGDPE